LVDGKILLNDLYKVLNLNENTFDEIKGEADTLAGLILEIKGELPIQEEQITYNNFQFKIKSVDNRRIKEIEVKII
jgi:CBS domain containing-hemolysin-like protein